MAREKKGLGKGLGALIPASQDDFQKGLQLGGNGYRDLPIGAINVNPYQPRALFDEEMLSSLTASVREVGVLQPVLVRAIGADKYELIAGERRWRAAKRAGLKKIPAIIRNVEDLTSLEHALVENLHRQDLGPLEEAAAYQQLIDDFGLSQEAVAQRVGKNRSTIANSLRLLHLPASVQSYLLSGAISAGHARALLALASRQEQDQLAQRIVQEELNVRDVEKIVREGLDIGTKKKTKTEQPKSVAVLEVEHRLTESLDTTVSVSTAGKRGKITIEFADLDDLERIFSSIINK
ncbi:MAG: ParB/RepB/Spo0J family partition protein [Acidimicrobiales bacterium]|nr:ParB/RepB/Spo0J family partition protein [Acidimicrobiales bacterium]